MGWVEDERDSAARRNRPRFKAVVLYRRNGCHLCEAVEAELRSLRVTGGVAVVDIDGDPRLQARYFLRVPVVTVDGKEVFEAKMMDQGGKWKERLPSLFPK